MAEWSNAWLAMILYVGLCALSLLWTCATAPGFDVRSKHVLLSGATKGIGLAIAKKYAVAGAKVSLLGRSMHRLELARAEIQQAVAAASSSLAKTKSTGANSSGEDTAQVPPTPSVFVTVCDVSEFAQVARAVADANAFHARVTDHVVHAAVVATPGLAWRQDLAQIRRETNVSYFGAVNLFRNAAPAMIESGVRGTFVIVSAADALTRPIGSSAFSGSLEALRGLAEALRNELFAVGITVSMYYPGEVRRRARIGSTLLAMSSASSATVPPLTPTEGSDDIAMDSVDMADGLQSLALRDVDAAAQSLVDGLRAGYFLITNSWSGFCYRVASAGFTPRKIVLFECTLGVLLVPYFEVVRRVCEWRLRHHAAAVETPK